jgi:AraC-like DNA-binding protein
MTATESIEHCVTAGDLVAELEMLTPLEGANVGLWPGLTTYRFAAPTPPTYEEMRGLAVGVVAQGRKVITDAGRRYKCDRFTYLVISSRLQFQSEVLEASPHKPCLYLVLHIEPSTVRTVSAGMPDRGDDAQELELSQRPDACYVSTLDDQLVCALMRFLQALSDEIDRRVLASLYLQEIVYRVLQREQFSRMLHFTDRFDSATSIAGVMSYIRTHLAEPLTVADLAEQVNLSPSAFARMFREVTGTSPYRCVKEMRLDKARNLLIEDGLAVANVAAAVGYASTSHFIKEFRARFGTTPGGYFDVHSVGRRLKALPAARS